MRRDLATLTIAFTLALFDPATVMAQPIDVDNVFLTDPFPNIWFNDTTADDEGEWIISGHREHFEVYSWVAMTPVLHIDPDSFSAALGFGAVAAGNNSTALGDRAFADQPNTLILGSIAGVNGASGYANVGIGTPAPAEAVDVERSAAAARFQLTAFTSTANEAPQYIQRRARGTRSAPAAVQNNDNLGLFSFRGYNGTSMGGSRATITAQAAGAFSASSTPTRLIFATTPVGKTAPEPVLVITPDGKVQVKGVNLNVPDYVFEDNYELMPLEELRTFIDEHGHLPGIPSAVEVNAEGHDLAGSDMAYLRKIEELTLYTLQLQEQLLAQQEHAKAQESRLEAQQGRIDRLEALFR